MSALKVGIIGFRGFVGSAFYEAFSKDKKYETIGIEKENCDSLKGSSFHILINANGNSSKPLADKDPLLDFEMNASSTLRFLRYFPSEHYVHVSTVDVYEDKSSPAATREGAKINPLSLSNYGFSKYVCELVAQKHSKSWLILRLAGMVGPNMKKGPAYDILQLGRLFVSPDCKYHFMHTKDVARIAKELCEKGKWNEIYNVVGKGSIQLSKFAQIANVQLSQAGPSVSVFGVSTSKLESVLEVPSSLSAVQGFVADWKDGALAKK